MGINVVEKIDAAVKINHRSFERFGQAGVGHLCPPADADQSAIQFLSTGGTYQRLKEILGQKSSTCLKQVSEYTGQPETQGGLVKTLDFKIYLGLLTETYNDAHKEDLSRTNSVPIDMVVVNLYPFKETISRPGVTAEQARGNIDIGGPCMIRASAKNFIRVASVVDPGDYDVVLAEMEKNLGFMSLDLRFRLAQKAFEHTAVYDRTIADFLASRDPGEVQGCYNK